MGYYNEYFGTMSTKNIKYILNLIEENKEDKYNFAASYGSEYKSISILRLRVNNIDEIKNTISVEDENEIPMRIQKAIIHKNEYGELLVGDTIVCFGSLVESGSYIRVLMPKGYYIDRVNNLPLSKADYSISISKENIDNYYKEIDYRLYKTTNKKFKNMNNESKEEVSDEELEQFIVEDRVLLPFNENTKNVEDKEFTKSNPKIQKPQKDLSIYSNIYVGICSKEKGKVDMIFKTLLPAFPDSIREEYFVLRMQKRIVEDANILVPNNKGIYYMIARRSSKYLNNDELKTKYSRRKIFFIVEPQTFSEFTDIGYFKTPDGVDEVILSKKEDNNGN